MGTDKGIQSCVGESATSELRKKLLTMGNGCRGPWQQLLICEFQLVSQLLKLLILSNEGRTVVPSLWDILEQLSPHAIRFHSTPGSLFSPGAETEVCMHFRASSLVVGGLTCMDIGQS